MTPTMIDILVAICVRAAKGNPISIRGTSVSTWKALERRKLVRRRWLGNTKRGRWVLQPTPLGQGVKRAYDLGHMRGKITGANDLARRIREGAQAA